MRHSLITLAASAVLSTVLAGLALGAAPASAASLPKLDSVTTEAASPVEAVRYYRRGYRAYGYRRPYAGFYAPRPYYGYGYGYGYRPYYRNYGYRYGYRPYYGRRYW